MYKESGTEKKVQNIYELTPLQEGILFQSLYGLGKDYVVQTSYIFHGSLTEHHVRESLAILAARHETLRSAIVYEKIKQPFQVVLDRREIDFSFVDLSEQESEGYIEKSKAEERERGFHLTKDSLLRLKIIQTAKDTSHFIWTFHHILMDGWCIQIISEELELIYTAVRNSRHAELPPVPPYSRYIQWLRKQRQEEDGSFWKQYLAGCDRSTGLPVYHHSAAGTSRRNAVEMNLSAYLPQMQQLASRNGVTVNTLLQSVWALLLSRLNDTHTVVFGVVVSGRPAHLPGIEQMVGLFINTLPCRIDLDADQSFEYLLQRMQHNGLQLLNKQYSSLADIQAGAGPGTRLVDHVFIFENYPIAKELEKTDPDNPESFYITGAETEESTHYHFSLVVQPDNDVLCIKLEYDAGVYPAAYIQSVGHSFVAILEQVLNNPATPINQINLLSTKSEQELLCLIQNQWYQPVADGNSVLQSWQSIATRQPDTIAFIHQGYQHTYGWLEGQSNRLAHYLTTVMNTQPGEAIALLPAGTAWSIAAILAIWKARGIYVPTDPDYPEERISFMLEEAGVKLVLTDIPEKQQPGFSMLYLPGIAVADHPAASLTLPDQEQTAYIIFTSGSSGKPKGVAVTHRSLSAIIEGLKTSMHVQPNGNYLLIAPFSFDASLKTIFVPLTIGATLHSFGKPTDLQELKSYIETQHIQVMHATPGTWEELLHITSKKELSSLTYISSGGEAMSRALANRLRERFGDRPVYNTYGPTEGTINASVHRLSSDSTDTVAPPIGRQLPGYRLYIVDDNDRLQPLYTKGEICIAGTGVAVGYLSREEMNTPQFKEVPFEQGRVYKTGDQGIMMANGELLFLGRKDNQVKWRGYRIELSEIDLVLEQYAGISRAHTRLTGSHAEGLLVSYYQANTVIEAADIRNWLLTQLPAYMVPVAFIHLHAFPVNSQGKIDSHALPDPLTGIIHIQNNYTPPATKTEALLVSIWEKILKVSGPGVTDNFFHLGGHSLKATRLMTAIQSQLHTNISIKRIFETPTIRQLAQHITDTRIGGELLPIIPVPQALHYPLSHAQRRIWLLCQFKEDSIAYNMPYASILEGSLNNELVGQSLNALVQRHESLRTVFIDHEGEPFQQVLENIVLPFVYTDCSEGSEASAWSKAEKLFIQNAEHAFDLEKGPLFLVHLIKLRPQQYLLVLVIHHIISDGWSLGILGNDFTTIYNTFQAGQSTALTPLPIHYKDYAAWHNNLITTGFFAADEQYWLEKLKDKPNGIELPADNRRTVLQTFNGRRITFSLPATVTASLQQLSKQHQATLYMTLTAILNVFLYKYAGQRDIILGLPVANRKKEELYNVAGFMVNTIVYRMAIDPQEIFTSFLEKVKEELLDIYEHQDYPFDMLVERLGIDRNLSQSPIFNVMVAYNNTETTDTGMDLQDIQLTEYGGDDEFNMSKFDLIFFIQEGEEGVAITLEYNSDLFDASTAIRMKTNLLHLAENICKGPTDAIQQLELIHPNEQALLIDTFNDTASSFLPKTVIDLFEDAVEQYGDRIAIRLQENSITYAQLNRRVNQLAHYLVDNLNIQPHEVVGVAVGRSIEMVIAIIGLIKAGAAYVAIDPDYPVDRIKYMINDSRIRTLLVDAAHISLFEGYEGRLIQMESAQEMLATMPDHNQRPAISMESPLYIIYTSGSTGMPNGAVLSHGLLANLIQWHFSDSGIEQGLSCLQFTSINFCVSFQEIFTTLCSGGLLHLIGEVERQDIEYLVHFLAANKVETLYLPFSYLNFLFTEANNALDTHEFSLRHIITAGEQLKITPGLRKFLDRYPLLKLHNHYGSSEMHVVTSYTLDAASVNKFAVPPAGTPVANTAIYILDEQKELVPVGSWGEVCVLGSYAVKGYLNNAALTAKRLYDHPVFSVGHHRLYCSGDIGRRLADGNIEIKGRKDDQVKIRGFRVEPGEVETAVFAFPHTRDCVVVIREDERGQKILLAYVVLTGGSIRELTAYLSSRLPAHMVPKLILLEALPLMPNGKVNKVMLPEPSKEVLQNRYVPPYSDKEKILVSIWEEILGISPIGITDHFFESGGHSLKATKLVSAIYNTFRKKLDLILIFKHPTIESLATFIDDVDAVTQSAFLPAPDLEHYPLTPEQRQLWRMDRLYTLGSTYNMPMSIRIQGPVNEQVLQQGIQALIERHEALRTSFKEVDGEPVQRILPAAACSCLLEFHDLQLKKEHAVAMEALTALFFEKPFLLEQAPLIRFSLFRISNNDHLFLVNIHHIIADAQSCTVILNDLARLYATALSGKESDLPVHKVRFRDHAYQLKELSKGEQYITARNYWLQHFSDVATSVTLPTDMPRPLSRSFTGATMQKDFKQVAPGTLKQHALKNGTTLFTLLVSVVRTLFYKYTGQEDLTIGGIISGRTHQELDQLVGLFVQTLPLRTKIDGSRSFSELLSYEKKNMLEAIDNSIYPIDKLIEELQPPTEPGRFTLFDAVITLEHHENKQSVAEEHTWTAEHNKLASTTSKFDLAFSFEENETGLSLRLAYNTSIFRSARIERLIDHIGMIITAIAANPAIRLDDISYLTEAEVQQQLYQFNTPVPAPPEYSLSNALQTVLQEYAQQVAIADKHHTLTYAALDELSGHIASYLIQEQDVKPGDVVAILGERSAGFIAAVIGIIRTGAAYLPIDPDYPEDRIEMVLSDAGARIVVDDETAIYLTGNKTSYREVALQTACQYDGAAANWAHRDASSTAYIIYTSGSSGKPKGVPISDVSLQMLAAWNNHSFNVNHKSKYTFSASPGFDASVWELWSALLAGAEIYIVDERIRTNLPALCRFLRNKAITHCFLPTPVYERICILDDLEAVRAVTFLTGGDRLKKHDPRLKAWNNYGPAEAAVVATSFNLAECEASAPIPIGKPVHHHQVYLLDQHHKLVPIGITGEIAIGGPYISQGYIKQPARTEQHFVANPFLPGSRMYLTGDLGRWREDGSIEFMGREDNQVQVRGKRVETGEIEKWLMSIPGIKDCLVIVQEAAHDESFLVAYLATDTPATPENYTTFLKRKLPAFMLPRQFVCMEQLPLTANGKIDRAALPPVIPPQTVSPEAMLPVDEMEISLLQIWKKAFSRDDISLDDNFFYLGGHSLTAVDIRSGIQQQLNIDCDLRLLFENPTVVALAEAIRQKQYTDRAPVFVTEPPTKVFALSFEQLQIWIADKLDTSKTAYIVPLAFELTGKVQPHLLDRAFKQLVKEQEILRTVFHDTAGNPFQQVLEMDETLFTLQLRTFDPASQQIEQLIREASSVPFSLSVGPLIRLQLFQQTEQQHYLLLTVHHIIFDGWSAGIFLSRLLQYYEQLPTLESQETIPVVQFRDFVTWQQQYLSSNAGMQAEEFWLNRFRDYQVPSTIPTDHVRSGLRLYKGGKATYQIDTHSLQVIRSTSATLQTPDFNFFFSCLNVLLYHYTTRKDLVIGVPFTGRHHTGFEELIGFFVNTMPLRTDFRSCIKFSDLLSVVKEDMMGSLNNQSYPSGKLLEKISWPGKETEAHPYRVGFTWHSTFRQPPSGSMPFEISDYPVAGNDAKEDLWFHLDIEENKAVIVLEYDLTTYKAATAEAWLHEYVRIIRQATTNIHVRLDELAMQVSPVVGRKISSFRM